MRIKRCKNSGMVQREAAVLAVIERELPDTWLGYSALAGHEFELVVVTPERVLLVDFKDWPGVVTADGGIWYQNGTKRGRSPVSRLREVAREVRSRLEQTLRGRRQPPPYVDSLVVFNSGCDTSQLPEGEAFHTMLLEQFVKIGDPKKYDKAFPRTNPGPSLLQLRSEFDKFFCVRDLITG